ncbi:MAG: type I-U CRISPR-associated helicase/endonuclease Cas3 [Gammaproteobacteria bacterium]|nr:type I-U CRISPR-associated helicase/endonuclease Cas3 [Gammaproteobacteria bacterium]MDE0269961.1 type I-U CRISPR-associated helicase/endonuclease Cas3 [Gammaproteobacteria bacterium]
MSAELNHSDFNAFFKALWGVAPFAWQEELATRVLGSANPWPEVIDLPTGSGKTACIDIALFALAAQASETASGAAVTAPRRIFFVVDRRIIVDEAHARAKRLANKLASSPNGILKTVADSLLCLATGGSRVASGDEHPLAVHALRGGMYRSEAWLRNPLQPTVVASTVDQVGSRLLFRGYGRRPGVWPVAAGLIANDSLILLDEAHCAQPLLETLRAVGKYREWAEQPLQRCFHAVVMSATLPSGAIDVFRDESSQGRDPSHPLGQRQLAEKPASLRPPIKVESPTEFGGLAQELAAVALELVNEERRAIVIFTNRVATARATYRLLKQEGEGDAILLTGRMRAVDREAVSRRLEEHCLYSSDATHRGLERPVFVVATQTLEVGADLDFDGLVTECASLDALRQRFGRLNRMGRRIKARAKIVIRADQAKPKRGDETDPVYGNAITATWKWLLDQCDAKNVIDFKIAAMDERLRSQQDSLSELNAPSPSAPVMLPAHVDCWAQTAPVPQPSPDVVPFLRGPQQGAPDVQVCWRADLDLAGRKEAALEVLRLCPPNSLETLPVPIGVFKRWLAENGDIEDPSADVLHTKDGQSVGSSVLGEPEANDAADRSVVRWRGRETGHEDVTSTPGDIRPGDVIVIPTNHPGAWSQLGDLTLALSADPNLLDVGDRSHRLACAKPILRLHKSLVSAWPDEVQAKLSALALLASVEERYEEDPDGIAEAIGDLQQDLAVSDAPKGWEWLPDVASELRREFSSLASLRRACQVMGGPCLVVAGRRRVEALAGEADSFSDEDDATASGISHRNGSPVPLRAHLLGVSGFARSHAESCGLSEALTEALSCAGKLHDLGKADPRFQSMLGGGSPLPGGVPLAKSAQMPQTRAAWQKARDSARYPKGARHELLSVRLAEAAPTFLPEDADLRDLVLHLVASHHGHCRPFAPVVLEDEEIKTEFRLDGHRLCWHGPPHLERLDSGIAERYWRLTRRYGWWGLAWLEALLRLADWRRSAWEEANVAEQ